MNSNPETISTEAQEGVSARGFALLVIVALSFSVRADIDSSSQLNAYSSALIAGAIGALLSVVLNFASGHFSNLKNLEIRERWLISAYASTIMVMIFFVLYDTILTGYVWYDMYSRFAGSSVIPTALAIISTFLLLLTKAKFINRNIIVSSVALYNFLVVLGCGLIVYVISIMSTELFQGIFRALSGKA